MTWEKTIKSVTFGASNLISIFKICWIRTILSVFVMVTASVAPGIAETKPPGTVLLLNSYHPGFSWSDEEEAGVVERLREKFPRLDISIEYLDGKRFPEKANLARVKNILIDKYHDKPIDLIIALDDDAVDMLTQYHTELFPGVPTVFAGITDFSQYAARNRKRITGVLEVPDIKHTIDTIIRLHPDTGQLLAISDKSVGGISVQRALESMMPTYADRIKIRFLPSCTFEQVRTAVAALPDNTIILLAAYEIDSSGKTLTSKNSTRLIVSAANVPVYGIYQKLLGDGIVGGYLLSGRKHGQMAADLGLRILAGEDPGSIPIEEKGSSLAMFDYEQMERFGIPLSTLPENSIVINKPESVFTDHRKLAVTTLTVLALLVVAILLLVFFIVRLSQAKARLRNKTDELDHFFSLSPDLFCIGDLDGRLLRTNPAWETVLGYGPNELVGKRGIHLVHPDDVEATNHIISGLEPGKKIIGFINRYRCKDGTYRWIEWNSLPYRNSLVYAAARDITTRKQTEIELKKQKDRLEHNIEGANAGTWEWNIQTGETHFNERWADILGYTLDEIKPVSIETWFKYAHPEDLKLNHAALEAHFNGESDYYEFESRMKHKNGHWVWILDRGKVISRTDDGKPLWMYGTHHDITERKQNEEAIHKAAIKYKAILQTAIDGFWLTDLEGRLLEVNEAYCKMSGYSETELLSIQIPELEGSLGPEEIAAKIEEAKYRGQTRFETKHRRKDGGLYDVEVGGQYLAYDNGRLVIFLRDISERKKSEEILHHLSETWELAQKGANIGHWSYDIKTGQPIWSDQMYNVLGCDPKEGPPDYESHKKIIHPDDWEIFDDAVRAAANGTSYNIEMRTVFSDGSVHWCNTKGFPRRDQDGEITKLYGITQDITERKQAELSLRESEAKMRSILDSADLGIVLISPDMKVLELNKRMREWFPEVNPKKHPICYQAFHDPPLGMQCEDCPASKTLQDGKVNEAIMDISWKGGTRSFRLITSPVHDPSGRITAVIEITEDITEKRSLELQLQQAQKMESIGRLAGGVAHDLNNLLSPILGYTELLMADENRNPSNQEKLQSIHKAGIGARDLVSQLLAFSRKQTLATRLVDVDKILEAFKPLLLRTIREDIQIKIISTPAVKTIIADQGQLEQVIMNLSVNAADAMPDGGILTIETDITQLDEAYASIHPAVIPGHYVLASFTDTGYGMPKETRDMVFEPFYSTKGSQGTGLGLATVYGIVKQHNGYIWIYSEVNEGSTFKVYLPYIPGKDDKSANSKVSADELTGCETILLAEDNEDVRDLVTDLLKQNGYTVLLAENGNDALEIWVSADKPVDLLVTDVIMPGMNGKELFTSLQSLDRHIKVLYMSGYPANAIARHGVLDPEMEYIQKPFSSNDFLLKLRRILD